MKEKVYFVGDYITDSGPANANKEILKSLKINFDVCVQGNSKFKRVLEVLNKVLWANTIFVCSKSSFNYFVFLIARLLKRKIINLMHGDAAYESKINDPTNTREYKACVRYDTFVVKKSTKTICVSPKFKDYITQVYPEYSKNIYSIFNVVDLSTIKRKNTLDFVYDVMSVGTTRRKNIEPVLEALCHDPSIHKILIVGDVKSPSLSNNFVIKNHLNHENVLENMALSKVYIQNSLFETFGLAVIEALYSGCSLLLSQNIGCLDLFSSLEENDLIQNPNDVLEIRTKIDYLLNNPNNERLLKGFLKSKLTNDFQAKCLKEIIENERD